MFLTKESLKKQILESKGRDVEYGMEDLELAFAFKRIDGQEFALRKLINPFLTEREASICSPINLQENIKTWCKSEGFFCMFSLERRVCVFVTFY